MPQSPENNKALQTFVIERAREAQQQLDQEMARIPNVCSHRCDACCHQMVYVQRWEEEAIREHIASKMPATTKQLIKEQFTAWWQIFAANTRPSTQAVPLTIDEQLQIQQFMREKRVPCPFLVNRECSIYPVRPAICRFHVVTSSPWMCTLNPHRETDPRALEPFGRIFGPYSAIMPMGKFPHSFQPLAYIAMDLLDLNAPSRPLESPTVGGDEPFP